MQEDHRQGAQGWSSLNVGKAADDSVLSQSCAKARLLGLLATEPHEASPSRTSRAKQ